MDTRLPDNVTAFIRDHIDSIEQLEVLLLLRMRWERIWTAPELSAELRSTPDSVLRRLQTLERRGLAERANGGFRFAVSQTAAVDRLAGCYGTHRVAVIETIFSFEGGFRAPVNGR